MNDCVSCGRNYWEYLNTSQYGLKWNYLSILTWSYVPDMCTTSHSQSTFQSLKFWIWLIKMLNTCIMIYFTQLNTDNLWNIWQTTNCSYSAKSTQLSCKASFQFLGARNAKKSISMHMLRDVRISSVYVKYVYT